MVFVLSPKLLKISLCVWLVACVLATTVSTDVVFGFAYFVLPTSALVVPVLVAVLVVQAHRNRASPQQSTSSTSVALEVTSYALLPVAYFLAVAVLARLLELPWRRAKFGEAALDLGLSAAGAFSVAAMAVMGLAFIALRRLRPSSRAWAAATASIAMLSFASLLYFVLGLSPLVHWRA